ncbi:MAG: orotidine-5'-phosphate decarboxylase [Alphaproteobacteria bacterium]|nr:orotidine-5'-phosphate decarboxylase [Alphaproteobacteria bacterium]
MTMTNPVFCALDTPDVETARDLALKVKNNVGGLKLGLEFFMANGNSGYGRIADLGLPIFLDVKLHDIPNTVQGAVNSLLPLKPGFITIHASGGPAMMRAAADTAAQAGAARPKLLGVTVLTSLDSGDLKEVGQSADVVQQVQRLALLAKANGLDGVICSPAEIAMLREACGPDFILMVPGIRPAWSAKNDQKRIMTPKEALNAGATYLVIGRPIRHADDPAGAARRITEEIAA